MDITPPLPIAEEFRAEMDTERTLTASQAHQVLLYCALDAASVPMDPRDMQAIGRVAELDWATVQRLINWIRAAGTGRF
ncbi:hypothetical protein AB0942_04455 [Streptomyces nodosus]|uniref:hypothetical protein n=1 Tax=Streptomyces nodosus TaxID=40318 RepID=UPI0034559C48